MCLHSILSKAALEESKHEGFRKWTVLKILPASTAYLLIPLLSVMLEKHQTPCFIPIQLTSLWYCHLYKLKAKLCFLKTVFYNFPQQTSI